MAASAPQVVAAEKAELLKDTTMEALVALRAAFRSSPLCVEVVVEAERPAAEEVAHFNW